MSAASIPSTAWRDLRRTLIRRRLARIDPILALELAAIAFLSSVFLFWQARTRLASLAHDQGAAAVAWTIAATELGLALSGAAASGLDYTIQLRRGPKGPTWLALPIAPRLLARHLAWEAEVRSLWIALPVVPLLIAVAGLIPAWWMIGLTGAGVVSWIAAGRLAVTISERLSLAGAEPRPGLDPLIRLLARAARNARRRRVRPAIWRREAPWLALCRKDLASTFRPTRARRYAIRVVLLWGLSIIVWMSPRLGPPVALALSLLTAAAVGAWLIALSAEDPFAVTRTLPIGLASLWRSRAVLAGAAVALITGTQALAARGLELNAEVYYLAVVTGASLIVTLLALNYSLSLYPSARSAQNVLALMLGLSLAASLMIPLVGWIVLFATLAHSFRRLRAWPRLEVTP